MPWSHTRIATRLLSYAPLLALSLVGVYACGSSTNSACTPGATRSCVCPGNTSPGAQSCNSAGTGFEACNCVGHGSGGTGGSGGQGGSSSSATGDSGAGETGGLCSSSSGGCSQTGCCTKDSDCCSLFRCYGSAVDAPPPGQTGTCGSCIDNSSGSPPCRGNHDCCSGQCNAGVCGASSSGSSGATCVEPIWASSSNPFTGMATSPYAPTSADECTYGSDCCTGGVCVLGMFNPVSQGYCVAACAINSDCNTGCCDATKGWCSTPGSPGCP
jgi:hypothetical protein